MTTPHPYATIRRGSRVTFVDRFGATRTGRAVLPGPYGWVLNMGGAHGTPHVVDPDSVVAVKPPRGEDAARGRAAMERAKADALARFGPVADLPDDKVGAFLAYRQERYEHHYRTVAAG